VLGPGSCAGACFSKRHDRRCRRNPLLPETSG
jgi:hypothetical protein